MTKRLHIKTYGCQMNVYDSARMADTLLRAGYTLVDKADDADVIVLNTCHIREKASEKLYAELGRLRGLKRRLSADGGPALIAVAGCVAQAEGAELVERAPFVDIVLGPQTLHRLPELIDRAQNGAASVLATEFPVEPKFDFLPEPAVGAGAASAFLTVQEGCDKFCTFCVVPYTRGAEYSRPVDDVVREARIYAERGVKEVTLLGQNVNSYHGLDASGRPVRLAALIDALAKIRGLERIRYTTSHPLDHDDDLIRAHAKVPQLMPYLHLPAQSGSDRILRAMHRGYTADQYRRLVDRLRGERPDLALSSDFIVGFPGETDADFEATLRLVDGVQYAQAYSFKYSPRPGTPAAAEPQLSDALKQERLQVLQERLARQQRAFNHASVDRTVAVLLEKPGRWPGQLVGRSPYMQAVHLDADAACLGRIVDVRIVSAGTNSLGGVMAAGAGQ